MTGWCSRPHPLPWDNKGAKQFILRMFLKDELGYWTWATVLALLFKSEKKKAYSKVEKIISIIIIYQEGNLGLKDNFPLRHFQT